MARTSKARLQNAFERLSKHLGYGPEMFLNECPNGHVIPAKRGENGSVSPISYSYLTKAGFCDAVEFLERALAGRKVTPVLEPHVGYPLGLTD